jgi:hypothetical protein
VLNTLAVETPTRLPRFVGAALVAALAFVPFANTTPEPARSPCSMITSEHHPRATIRTRTHALTTRYMTRTLCAKDSAGRIRCAR